MGKRLPTLTAVEVEPFADRLDQLEDFYDEHRLDVRAACKGRGIAPQAVGAVLKVLVMRTDRRTGLVSETLAQLAKGSLECSTDQVRRALTVLRTLGWIETVTKPKSPGRHGGTGTPTVSRVTFLRPRLDPVLVPGESTLAPVENPVMAAHGYAHPFPVENPVMAARETGMAARLTAHPHGLEPRNVVTSSSQSFISSEPTETTPIQTETWVDQLTAMTRRRHGGRLSINAHAELLSCALGMESQYGRMALDVHGSFLVDYLTAKANGKRIDPALLDYLAHHSLRADGVAV